MSLKKRIVNVKKPDIGFSERLGELIGDASKASFARKCGFSEGALKNYLSNSIPSADKALAIADVTGVNIRWLLTGEEPMWADSFVHQATMSRTDRESFLMRMRECATSVGSVNAWAKRANIPTSTLQEFFRDRDPRRVELSALAGAARVRLDWLATGSGPVRRTLSEPSSDQTEAELLSGYVEIPLYRDVRANAGGGAVVEDEAASDRLAFKRDFIHRVLGASADDLCLLAVDGESMEPTLRPGDVTLIDRRDAPAVRRDGIYVLRLDDALLVKRLQRLPGPRLRVSGDNPAYEPFTVDLAKAAGDQAPDDIAVIGRVVWVGRRI